jgi:hypothetical protein
MSNTRTVDKTHETDTGGSFLYALLPGGGVNAVFFFFCGRMDSPMTSLEEMRHRDARQTSDITNISESSDVLVLRLALHETNDEPTSQQRSGNKRLRRGSWGRRHVINRSRHFGCRATVSRISNKMLEMDNNHIHLRSRFARGHVNSTIDAATSVQYRETAIKDVAIYTAAEHPNEE